MLSAVADIDREESSMPGAIFIALTNSTEGRDEEYNEWYSGPHIEDILAIDGIASVQRYVIADTPHAVGAPYRYLAVYEVEEGRTAEALAAFAQAGRDGKIPLSGSMADERSIWWFLPVDDKKLSN